MSWLHQLFTRRHRYSELSEAIREHLEEKIADLMDQGMLRKEAERAARREFGNVTLIEERSREVWHWPRMETLILDIKFGARQMLRNPGFTIVAVLTLALGIGAVTAVFTVINSVLLRPLAFPQPDRIFQLEKITATDFSYPVSIPLFQQWKTHNRVFDHIAAYSLVPVGFNLAEKGIPERIPGLRVSTDFFRVLGVTPQLGRNFAIDDDQVGSPHVVIVGDSLWHHRYNNDPSIIGKSITLNGQSYTVIGILPPRFQFLATGSTSSAIEIWTPLQLPATSRDSSGILECIGRLNPGVTPQQASSQITALSQQLSRQLPGVFPSAAKIVLLPLQQRITQETRPTLLLLFGAVGFVLLIACANVANLLLARMSHRAKEIGVRTALGANRLRIIRQILTENLLLALSGGILGLVVAWLCNQVLFSVAPLAISRFGKAPIDWRVLLFTMAASLLTTILFGLLPMLRIPNIGAMDALHNSSSRSSTSSRGRRRLASAFIVAETALSLMLLITAGLLMASFVKLQRVNPGFSYDRLSTFETTLPVAKYGDPIALQRFIEDALQRVQGLPGVESAAGVSSLPTEATIELPFTITDAPTPAPGQPSGDSAYFAVSPAYFQTMQIPVLEGRSLAQSDSDHAPGVVVINQAMARQFWPNEDPIGKRITIAKNLGPDWVDEQREIVGIVGDAKAELLEEPAPPSIYTPFAQLSPHFASVMIGTIPISWAVRTKSDPSGIVNELRNAMLSVDSDEPIAAIKTMRELLSDALTRWRFNMLLLGAFAGIAFFLAMIGIYGVISYTVAERTHEIGIRMALGARRSSILWMILRHGTLLLAGGTLIGLAGVAIMGHILRGFIYGVEPGDKGILFAVVTLVCSVGLMAAWRPAHRAASINPTQALRSE